VRYRPIRQPTRQRQAVTIELILTPILPTMTADPITWLKDANPDMAFAKRQRGAPPGLRRSCKNPLIGKQLDATGAIGRHGSLDIRDPDTKGGCHVDTTGLCGFCVLRALRTDGVRCH
jgi:hypothetical protein